MSDAKNKTAEQSPKPSMQDPAKIAQGAQAAVTPREDHEPRVRDDLDAQRRQVDGAQRGSNEQ